MSKPLDATDQLILRTLRDDARMSLVALAKRINLSRSATRERLQRLERSGVIAGYTIRYKRPDEDDIRVWMFITFKPDFLCCQIVPRLMEHGAIRLCNSLAGKPDLIVLAQLASQAEIMSLRESIARIPGVAEVQTSPMLQAHFDAWTGEVSDIVAAVSR